MVINLKKNKISQNLYHSFKMKAINNWIFLLLLVFYPFHGSYSQQNKGKIKGYVYNSDGEPAIYSTVVLMNEDSVFMEGTLSQNNGMYLIDNVNPGIYLIMVRNVEFQTWISEPVNVAPGELVEMDPVRLKIKVTGLDEVFVTAKKAPIEVHPDKIVYNISSSVDASGNNGLELLGKAPGVIIDLDKNIILQGKSGVRVYINGRPSRLSGSDLSNMLEGMRSENIESIEIISNPSAKYEAEGSGGIINIILKKNTDTGFNGTLNGSYSKGNFTRANAGTSLSYNRGKLNLFSSFNISDDNFQDDIDKTTTQNDFLLDMESFSLNNRKGINFAGGADYSINELHSVSFDTRILVNNRDNRLESNTLITDENGIEDPELLYSRAIDDLTSDNYNFNLHYQYTTDRTSTLTADVSYGKYLSGISTWQPNEYYTGDGNDFLRSIEDQYDGDTEIDLFSAQVDFDKKLGSLTISGGTKYSSIHTGNTLKYYNLENGTPEIDILRSNDFSYLENIVAAYMLVNTILWDKINVNAGFRVENTASLGELTSVVPTENDVVPRNYTSLFPNLSFSYDDQENHALSISIGRRITRPNYRDLNPFESKLSEISSWKGNPFLKPNYITNYQLSYSFKRKLVISNTFSITRDFFATIFEVTDDKSSILIPRNMDRVTNNGLSVSYPQKVTKWWNISTFVIYNHETYDGKMEGTVIDLKTDKVFVRVQNNLQLPLGIVMEVTYYGSSPWIWRGTIHVDDYHSLNVGLKKEFLKSRLMLQVTGNDILRTSSDYYYNNNYGGMITDGVRTFDNQRVGFTLIYKFGNQKLKSAKRRSSAMDEELQRISE